MLHRENSVRVMALHALLYCERLYYLEEVESIYVANDRVYAGRTLHEEQRPSSDIVERIESFEVTESRLGLTGKVDRLMKRDGQWIPYEHKTGRCRMGDAGPEAWESDRVQIAAYALLLEEVTGRTIEEGRVRYHGDNQLVKVPIDDNLRKQALNAIDRAHELSIQPNRPPIVSNEHLCKHCSLAPVCLPEENRAVSEGSYKAVRLFPEKRERATVHITGYRTRIKKSADTIIVEKFNAENESVVEKIPAHNVESLNLHGNCQVSAQMIRYLARQEINLHWFTGGGEYVGGLQPGGPAVQRRLRQYEALRDPQFRMNLARRLIQAKCESQLKYILRSTRKNQKLRGDIDRSIEIMRTLLKKIEAAESSGTLLGIEGSFARRYHGIVPRLLNTEIESCLLPQGRSKRPPRDPYNACLSFLYALLYRSVRQAIIAVGLDPCFGFFHTARSAAEPLVLDMIELFRVTLCDMPLIGSMNRLFWKEADFMITKSKVWLNEDGRKKAIQIFESRLDDHWKHPVIGYSLSYYRMIELEVRLLEKEWGDNVQTFAKARLR